MNQDHLLRHLAPISDRGWALIDAEAAERIGVELGARRLVDFAGPHGWGHSATSLGSTEPAAAVPVDGITALRRRVLPLVEVRADFALSRQQLQDYDRGAVATDLGALDDAVASMARIENVAVFHGWAGAGLTGIAEATVHPDVQRVEDFNDYPARIADAVDLLRRAGVGGPYGLAVGPADYTAIVSAIDHGGLSVFRHVGEILGGPIVWTPGVHGGVVLSLRGGDFLFESGQDVSVGYDHHDADRVHLYLEQSFSFRVATPEAAVVLARK
ncbi:putative linocin/CFP29 family protein [Cryobacterium sp. MP_M5]|uniref:family 1 encapsulin nanocompartment shell protein n=1 Tax=unclassified Cryobacterium TaxID=2649013 RepID=UPI0018CA1212|nr:MULTISPECIES: family 1 encapsulin nanocompartment shell protein [unclassified Cryobacterium]MBG6058770.1 putative linocin/CFP29 family protein [Cryobacterium sp. MP_M3]MEC5176751.1 putative linocin/CFP29 family protein [Cryobacterium sp. MP_M5]